MLAVQLKRLGKDQDSKRLNRNEKEKGISQSQNYSQDIALSTICKEILYGMGEERFYTQT
jgi:hypothetical protein